VTRHFVAGSTGSSHDAELDALAQVQPGVVASHGRFLHAPDHTVRRPAASSDLQLMQGG
jgi:hypothetical protein